MKFPKFLSFFGRTRSEQISVGRPNLGISGGTVVSEFSAMEVAAYYRGVIYISSQIAKLPWFIKDKDNNNLDTVISTLLNVSPNPEMTAFHFKLFLIQSAINHGEGYAEIERSLDGRVVRLWPLNPKRVCAMRDREGTLYYQVTQGDFGGETVYLPPKDIFIVRNIHTKDGITGLGLIGYAMNTLGISLGADRFANSLYSNGGMPSGVLKHPGKITPEAAKRIKESWKENHGGKKTGGTALLEEGVTYEAISHSPDILQFLESRQFGVLEIARFLGIPPTKLFDVSAAKYSNIEHGNLEVATDTLDTWAKNLESECDMKLLSNRRGGIHSELDLYSVFRGDMSTRATYFQKMMQSGAMTPNEIRMKEGLSPYSGGDNFYIASNNLTSHSKLDAMTDAMIEKLKSETNKNNNSVEPITTQEDRLIEEAIAKKVMKSISRG